jgi:hypothetical protein
MKLLFILLLASTAAGCASITPHVLCDLKGNAQVFQTVQGIGVGQKLPDANPLCKK